MVTRTKSKVIQLAVAILGLSLCFKAYSEIMNFFMMIDIGGNISFHLGRLTAPLAYYVFQAYLLVKILSLQNWARVTMAIVVLLNVLLVVVILMGSTGFLFGNPFFVATRVLLEAVAVTLLFASQQFIRADTSVT